MPNREENRTYINNLDSSLYVHASNIKAKYKKWDVLKDSQKKALPHIVNQYISYIQANQKLKGYSSEIIQKRTKLLNTYYDFIEGNNYHNVFTSQSKFRSTILEEFMYILFKDLIEEKINSLTHNHDKLKIGGTRAYTNLFFSANNFKEFIESPKIGIHQKDQDFAIYRSIDITIENSNTIQTNLPIVAIENKTYIDKTMLEGSIATAEKIKSGNPYSLFFIVAENYEVDLNIDPVYSRINQIYVLRKSKRSKNVALKPIFSDVLIDLHENVKNHLERNWSDVEKKMKETGKIL